MLIVYTWQRGLFNLNERVIPQIRYWERIHLLNDILPGLTGQECYGHIRNIRRSCFWMIRTWSNQN